MDYGKKLESDEDRRKNKILIEKHEGLMKEYLAKMKCERKLDERKWKKMETNVFVDARLMLHLERNQRTVRAMLNHLGLHIVNLENIHTDIFRSTFNVAKSFLDRTISTLKDDNNQQKAKLTALQKIFRLRTLKNVRRDIEALYERIFRRRVVVERHDDFEECILLRLDLTFLPPSAFLLFGNGILPWEYKDYIEDGSGGGVNTMDGTMHFLNYMDATCNKRAPPDRFKLNNNNDYTDAVLSIVRGVLIEKAGVEEGIINKELEWSVGVLWTDDKNLQHPHIDYDWQSIKKCKRKQRNKGLPDTSDHVLPWSLDCALSVGSLRLAFYGADNEKQGMESRTIPFILHGPQGKALLWRGDCIHAGNLLDLDGEGGLRMHAYIPLLKGQTSMSNTVLPKIEWCDQKRRAYSSYKRKRNGSKYGPPNELIKLPKAFQKEEKRIAKMKAKARWEAEIAKHKQAIQDSGY